MRGHDQIIQMRIKGRKPLVINIIDHKHFSTIEECDVDVSDDQISKIDLRFVMDCLVTISSDSQERCDQLEKICIENGARQVAADVFRKHY